MTDQTEPTCPYCAEDVLAIAHIQGALSERDRTQPRIEALEAERDRLREVLEMVHADCIARAKKLPDGDFKVPVGASVWIAVCAALKGEGE